jgi:hypothetical protein
MVAEVDRRWIDRRGIVQKEINGLKVWIVGADAVIRWKKMDEDGYSSNYPTKQARDFDRGELLPGLPDPAVRLTAGYLLDPTQTQFVRAQIAKPRGKRIEVRCDRTGVGARPECHLEGCDTPTQFVDGGSTDATQPSFAHSGA